MTAVESVYEMMVGLTVVRVESEDDEVPRSISTNLLVLPVAPAFQDNFILFKLIAALKLFGPV